MLRIPRASSFHLTTGCILYSVFTIEGLSTDIVAITPRVKHEKHGVRRSHIPNRHALPFKTHAGHSRSTSHGHTATYHSEPADNISRFRARPKLRGPSSASPGGSRLYSEGARLQKRRFCSRASCWLLKPAAWVDTQELEHEPGPAIY